MNQKYWVVLQDGKHAIVKTNQNKPAGAVAESPDYEGSPVIDIDWLDIDVDSAVVNLIKKAAKESQQSADAIEATKRAQIKKQRARLDFALDIKAEVMVLNDTKGWDAMTWNVYLSNGNIKNMSALLTDGYLSTAKQLLESVDLTAFYTVGEKQVIIDKIQAYLNAE